MPAPSSSHDSAPVGNEMMHSALGEPGTLSEVERALVRLAAIVAVGDEAAVRAALADALAGPAAVPSPWVEEVILQSSMFAGFPRALNAMREWRRVSGIAAPTDDPDLDDDGHRARGETICAVVYGRSYEQLRRNVAALHPALDGWMVDTGYGDVLGRPGLDLARRELCVVAVCAATGQDRQLHSHLHGALNVGAPAAAIADALDAVADLTPERGDRARRLWAHVRDTAATAA